jgi:hypothetical protein
MESEVKVPPRFKPRAQRGDESDENARARGADRMAGRAGAAVDVHLFARGARSIELPA